MPRRKPRNMSGLRPRFGHCPMVLGQRPNEGHSPKLLALYGEAKPRLTSRRQSRETEAKRPKQRGKAEMVKPVIFHKAGGYVRVRVNGR